MRIAETVLNLIPMPEFQPDAGVAVAGFNVYLWFTVEVPPVVYPKLACNLPVLVISISVQILFILVRLLGVILVKVTPLSVDLYNPEVLTKGAAVEREATYRLPAASHCNLKVLPKTVAVEASLDHVIPASVDFQIPAPTTASALATGSPVPKYMIDLLVGSWQIALIARLKK
jgi:hypothetical protein